MRHSRKWGLGVRRPRTSVRPTESGAALRDGTPTRSTDSELDGAPGRPTTADRPTESGAVGADARALRVGPVVQRVVAGREAGARRAGAVGEARGTKAVAEVSASSWARLPVSQ